MSEKVCVVQSVEELKFSLAKLNNSVKVIPLNLSVQIYCIKNNLSFFNPIDFIENKFHKDCLQKSEKLIKNMKFYNLIYESHVSTIKAFIRFRFNSILFLKELLGNILKKNEIEKIYFSGWNTYHNQYSKKNYFVSNIAQNLYKDKKFKFLKKIKKKNTKNFFLRNYEPTQINKPFNNKMILLTNLGYNFSRLVKSIFEKNITILVPFDKKINVLKKTLYKLFNVSFFDFKYSKTGIKKKYLPKIEIKYRDQKIRKLLMDRFEEEVPNLMILKSKSAAIHKLFLKNNISAVFSQITRGEYGYYIEEANRRGIPSFCIPHGTMTESFNKDDKKYKNIISEAITLKNSKFICSQSKISKNFFISNNNVLKKRKITTGNLIFSEGKKNIINKKKIKLLFAVTLKTFESIQYLGVEPFYEFINNLGFLSNFVNRNNYIKVIVKIHPTESENINNLKDLFPNLQFTNDKIDKILKKIDITISFSSTVIEDSLYSFRPVILLDRWKRYKHCRATDNSNIKNAAVYYVNDEEKLKKCIDSIADSKNIFFEKYIYPGVSKNNIKKLKEYF